MGGAGADVVADVGDVDVQGVVAVGEVVHPDGVVEVAGGFAVDGDDVEGAEVAAGGDFVGGDDGAHRLGLLEHLGGEAVRQVVLADDDFDVDAEVASRPRISMTRPVVVPSPLGEVDDLDVDDHAVEVVGVAVFGGGGADAVVGGRLAGEFEPVGDLDPLLDAGLAGDDVVGVAAGAELADDGGVGALEDLDDFAFGAAIAAGVGDAGQHAVAVHGRSRRRRAG